MKRYLLPAALIGALFVPSMVQACGGMSPAQLAALMQRLARMEARHAPPPAAAPAPPPVAKPTPPPVAQAPKPSPTLTKPSPAPAAPRQAAPTPPVVVFVPPPPPPPAMIQLSPQDIGSGLHLRSEAVESTNEQVTTDLHEGLIIS